MKTEIINGNRVKVYDNGGKTFDRYTAVYLDMPDREFVCCRGMSEHPCHAQGFGQFSSCMDGRHLGKHIRIKDLPVDCQKLINSDTKD